MNLIERVLQASAGAVSELRETGTRRLVGIVDAARVASTLAALKEHAGCEHLSALHAAETPEALEVLYHLSAPEGVVLTLKARVPKSAPRLPSVTSIMPVATLYEREAHDLFGIEFEGHPGLTRLLLHDEWPAGSHPLRKDWSA